MGVVTGSLGLGDKRSPVPVTAATTLTNSKTHSWGKTKPEAAAVSDPAAVSDQLRGLLAFLRAALTRSSLVQGAVVSSCLEEDVPWGHGRRGRCLWCPRGKKRLPAIKGFAGPDGLLNPGC